MITCKELPNREFKSKGEMLKAIIDNKAEIIRLKKTCVKETDGLTVGMVSEESTTGEVVKANNPVADDSISELKVKVVVNTTNLLDSHRDVHIPGIWKRTLDHNNKKLHLQEHKKDFDKVISNDAEAYTKKVTWKSLGAPFEGSTEALIFDSTVKATRNEEMFKQYKNGWVTNHSVGMAYVDIKTCINSEEKWAAEEKENWDKYYPMVANKEDADAIGYFFAVTEAKLVEGSAVLFGSNWVTPTLENNMKSEESSSFKQSDSSQKDTRTERKKAFIN